MKELTPTPPLMTVATLLKLDVLQSYDSRVAFVSEASRLTENSATSWALMFSVSSVAALIVMMPESGLTDTVPKPGAA